jgi:arabinofuranosyltransferase
MLLRYAQHVSDGHGIVWNIGEPPVDGSTDFLDMLAVAGVTRAGVGLETAAKAVGLGSHVLCVLVVYAAVRRWTSASPMLALIPAAYLAVGPGLRYVSASYGTTVFALTVAAGWWMARRLMAASGPDVRRLALGLGLCGVAMGMARPEGAFLALFFLGAVLVGRSGANTADVAVGFAIGFGALGLAYFCWRWMYFGHPLPNPFYRLGGGVLHTDVLARSARNVLRLGGVFLILLFAGLLRKESRRLALAVMVPVVLFTALWVFLSDETNYYMRYRYPILPVILIGAAEIGAVLASAPAVAPLRRMPRTLVSLAAVAFMAVLIVVQHRQLRHIEPRRMGLFDVARRLNPYLGKGYTLATTEAGLLPLYSQWRSIDAWGLNDSWIAQHGMVTAAYLDRSRPELVMFHAYFSPESPRDESVSRRGLGRAWDDTVRALQSYAEERGYELAAVFARGPHESHYYYVRRGFLDHDAIVAAVRVGDYEWDGQPASDLTPAAAR